MRYISTVLALYFEQDCAFSPLLILLIALITIAICLKCYELFASRNMSQCTQVISAFSLIGIMSMLVVAVNVSYLVYPTEIMRNSTFEEIDKYYILHFNPDNEAFIFDENGAIRVNGNERMIEVAESQLDKVNYIKIEADKLILNDKLAHKLRRNSNTYIHNYRVVEKKYEVK